jgi:hypothetical protein
MSSRLRSVERLVLGCALDAEVLLTVLLLAGQDGTLGRYRHHRRHGVSCIRARSDRSPRVCSTRLARFRGRRLIVHCGGRCVSVERKARRGGLSHVNKKSEEKRGRKRAQASGSQGSGIGYMESLVFMTRRSNK